MLLILSCDKPIGTTAFTPPNGNIAGRSKEVKMNIDVVGAKVGEVAPEASGYLRIAAMLNQHIAKEYKGN